MMDISLVLPHPVIAGMVFVFGLLIGSFSNVCIYRLPRRESVVFPGSRCPECSTPIRAMDNIPVFSYLFLLGQCRFCGSRISFVYPFTELVTALLVTAVFLRFGWTWEFLIYVIVCPALLVITVIDARHKIIPDKITLPGMVFGLAAGTYLVGIWASLLGFLVGGGLFYLVAVLSRGGMGGGDIKFIAAAGALLGWKKILLIIFLGAVLGSIAGLAWMVVKKKGRKSQIPFGPFLAVGTLIAIFFGDELIHLYLVMMT
ncbi:MAG: prepilin peptidase [Nitrospinaceae bacterium]